MPGAGLLLLRVTVGFTTTLQAWLYLLDPNNRTVGEITLLVLLFGTGLFLVIGLWTPVVSTLAAVYSVGIVCSLLPAADPRLFDGRVVAIRMIVMAVAVGLLGPGAYSVDAYLFGRRDIVIPPTSGKSDDPEI